MATTPTQIRIDADVKKQASALFGRLGIDMSSAVNMFLHQCILHEGLPFQVGMPAGSLKDPGKSGNPESAPDPDQKK